MSNGSEIFGFEPEHYAIRQDLKQRILCALSFWAPALAVALGLTTLLIQQQIPTTAGQTTPAPLFRWNDVLGAFILVAAYLFGWWQWSQAKREASLEKFYD